MAVLNIADASSRRISRMSAQDLRDARDIVRRNRAFLQSEWERIHG